MRSYCFIPTHYVLARMFFTRSIYSLLLAIGFVITTLFYNMVNGVSATVKGRIGVLIVYWRLFIVSSFIVVMVLYICVCFNSSKGN